MIRVLDLYNFGDESIVTNPVYNAMFSYVPHLKQDAYKKQVTLLIPMASSLTTNHFSSSFIQSHIAVPSPVYKDVFMTYSGKTLEINTKYVQTKTDKWNGVGFSEERCCRILYNDVISVDGNAEFRILLVDKPLEGSFYPLQVFPQSNVLFHSGHISEVFEYFVGQQQAIELVESIQKSINISFMFISIQFSFIVYFFNNNYIMNSTDASIEDALVKLQSWIQFEYTKVKTEICSKNAYYDSSLMIQLFLRRVVEMYYIERCYPKIIQNLIDNSVNEEILLQCTLSSIRKHGGLQPEDVCLNPICFYPDLIAKAAITLNRLTDEKTVLGKLNILWKTMKIISSSIKERLLMRRCMIIFNKNNVLAIEYEITGDDQLPLLILIICQSSLQNIIAQLRFITNFDFIQCRNNELDYCFASFSTAIDFLKQFKVKKTSQTPVAFHITKKQEKKMDLGLQGWKAQTQSVFNDFITQTSLEQATKEIAMRRSSSSSTPRSVISHVVKNVQDDFWWSQDLEAKLQKVEQTTFNRWYAQSSSSLSQTDFQLDERLSDISAVSDGSLPEVPSTEILPSQESSHWNWICCCDSSSTDIKNVTDSACEKQDLLTHADSLIFHVEQNSSVVNEFLPTCISDQSIQSTQSTQEIQEIRETREVFDNQETQSLQSTQSTQTATESTIPSSSVRNYIPSSRRYSSISVNSQDSDAHRLSIDDNGLGPFLTSIKTSKRKVLRSSDFM